MPAMRASTHSDRSSPADCQDRMHRDLYHFPSDLQNRSGVVTGIGYSEPCIVPYADDLRRAAEALPMSELLLMVFATALKAPFHYYSILAYLNTHPPMLAGGTVALIGIELVGGILAANMLRRRG